nr:hypothetical protein [Bradyrhizobium hereditatis]
MHFANGGERARQLYRSPHRKRAPPLRETWKPNSGTRRRWSSLLSSADFPEPFALFLMPFYYFDLLVDGEPSNQGGMILEDLSVASDRADALASELRTLKPELHSKNCFVRVVDENSSEIYRTPLEPVPSWSMRSSRK